MSAVAGHFPNLPPTPAPVGLGAALPIRELVGVGYVDRRNGAHGVKQWAEKREDVGLVPIEEEEK